MAKKAKGPSAAAKAMYAPKPMANVPAVHPEQMDPSLKLLARSVLEDLKVPGAIPSNIILAALAKAQSLGSAKYAARK